MTQLKYFVLYYLFVCLTLPSALAANNETNLLKSAERIKASIKSKINETAVAIPELGVDNHTAADALRLLNADGPLNGIKLLDNRFRIDYAVEEISLVFFRRYGSAPVILIRPDGSKLYAATMTPDLGDWFDDTTYDMIRLKSPMVGPWQVVGKVEKNSKIMVMSDIELVSEALPPIIFSGETIKIGAYLTNNGEPIKYAAFSDTVTLDVTFTSTNNNNYDNFGADAVNVATFTDDGKGFDQEPKDGVFTGEYRFDITPGEWLPGMYLDLGLFNREATLAPVLLEPSPFKISVEQTIVNGDYHLLKIEPDSDKIDFSSFVFNGKAFFPNGEVEQFVLNEQLSADEKPNLRLQKLMNYEQGAYKVRLTAFGKNTNNRDVMLELADFMFTAEPPPPPEPTAEEIAAYEAKQAAIKQAEAEAEALRLAKEQAEKERQAMIIIAATNVVFILIAIVLIRIFVLGKKPNISIPFKLPFNFKNKGKKDNDDKKKAGELNEESDDIIDLSMPEDE